ALSTGSTIDFQVTDTPVAASEVYETDNISIRIVNPDVPPVVSAPATLAASEGSEIRVQVGAVDPDGQAITSLTANLAGLPAGTLTWTPTFADGGHACAIMFTAANALSGSATATISVADVDRAPVVSAPATATATERAPVTVTVAATDPDAEAIASLTADLSGLPGGADAVFTPGPGNASGTLTWTPTFNDSGGPYT